MKRSPPSSSSCSSSSSSSCALAGPCDHQPEKKLPKSKRSRKPQKQSSDESQNNANSPVSGAARRSSIYRGVTRHRWTGRFEAHLWDKSSWNSIQNKKGRQVYLGAYDSEDAAARTYDLAALKYWGPDTTLNFSIDDYKKELEEMQDLSKEEYLASLRRRSSGFSRGVSKYRGVARHHHNGRWEARIGRVLGNKYLYLGTYNTQEEAAAAYDMAAIQYRGANAVTNFDISNYIDRLKKRGIHIDLPQQILHQKTTPNCTAPEPPKVEPKPDPEPEPDPVKVKTKAVKTKSEGGAVQVLANIVELKKQEETTHPHEARDGIKLYPELLSPCVDSSTIVMDEQYHPWNFSMEMEEGTYSSFHVSDIPLEKLYNHELPDLQLGDCKGFDDNIHLIFEVGSDQNDIELVVSPEHELSPPSSVASSPVSSVVSCSYSA